MRRNSRQGAVRDNCLILSEIADLVVPVRTCFTDGAGIDGNLIVQEIRLLSLNFGLLLHRRSEVIV